MYVTLHQKKEYIDADFDKLAEQIGDVPQADRETLTQWWHTTIQLFGSWMEKYKGKSMESYAWEIVNDYTDTLEHITREWEKKRDGKSI